MTVRPSCRLAARRASLPIATFGALCGVLLTGCPSPDVEGKLSSFLDDTEDEREEAQNVKMDMGGQIADVSGTFLFALDTIVQPGLPLQFIAEVTFTAEGAGGTIAFDLQPLALDEGSLTSPRTPVGDMISVPAHEVSEGGQFLIPSLGTLIVTGEANPITGSEIEADVSLNGSILSADIFCGQVGGEVFRPLMLFLDGSTFAAARVESSDPGSLPAMPLFACPAGGVGDGGEEGGSDGGSGSSG